MKKFQSGFCVAGFLLALGAGLVTVLAFRWFVVIWVGILFPPVMALGATFLAYYGDRRRIMTSNVSLHSASLRAAEREWMWARWAAKSYFVGFIAGSMLPLLLWLTG